MGRYSLVSACLVGIKCRYDGTSALKNQLRKHLYSQPVLLVCPEKLAGLSTPRPPVQIIPLESPLPGLSLSAGSRLKPQGKRPTGGMGKKPGRAYDGKDVWQKKAVLVSIQDKDVTSDFLKGCYRIKEVLKKVRLKAGYLKARSPCCGYGQVYNRHPLTGKTYLVKGNGVLGALLKTIRPRFPIKSV